MSAGPPESVDVIVCGGGPGGSTAATFLARAGLSVLVFERERFPRFHVGESLLPWNVPLFERLGVLEALRASGAQVKRGARFVHRGTQRRRAVRFADGLDRDHPSAFQVKRADFDQLLLDHARRSGAVVFEAARVEEVAFDDRGRATGVRVRLAGEAGTRDVAAKAVVDATGRDALLARRAGARVKDPLLDRAAAFAHFDRMRREPGEAGGDIAIVTTPDGWWWAIPFGDGTASVGIVMPSARWAARNGSVEARYQEAIAETPEVGELLAGATRTTEVHAIADYSYRARNIAGDGYCLVGDAAGFLDPVFSTGVLLAMRSAELAALAIVAALRDKGRVDARDFAGYARVYRGAVDRYLRFVHGFYRPHFLETFYTPAPLAQIEQAVTTTLAGDVFAPNLRARFWNLVFHGCCAWMWLQQRVRGRGDFEGATGEVPRA